MAAERRRDAREARVPTGARRCGYHEPEERKICGACGLPLDEHDTMAMCSELLELRRERARIGQEVEELVLDGLISRAAGYRLEEIMERNDGTGDKT